MTLYAARVTAHARVAAKSLAPTACLAPGLGIFTTTAATRHAQWHISPTPPTTHVPNVRIIV